MLIEPIELIELIEPNGPTQFVDRLAGKCCYPAAVRTVRYVATRRHFNVLHLSDRVRVAASHHQYIEHQMDWTGSFSLQDCTLCMYIHTYNTKDNLTRRGVADSFSPLSISLTCIFFLFELQASLSAERALRTFHYPLHRLF